MSTCGLHAKHTQEQNALGLHLETETAAALELDGSRDMVQCSAQGASPTHQRREGISPGQRRAWPTGQNGWSFLRAWLISRRGLAFRCKQHVNGRQQKQTGTSK